MQKSSKSASNVKLIAFTAMFAALVTIATAFIKIPTALGYQHPGDSMVYLAACVLPGPYGIIASGIGGALADLLSGYAYWALPTFIIKCLNAVPFVLCRMIIKKRHDVSCNQAASNISKQNDKDNRIINIPTLAMLIPTTAVTVFGYLFANALLYSWPAAVAELVTSWLQPAIGALLFIAIGTALDAAKFKQRILPIVTRK